jgi:Fur family iron response transcriptional regulator
MERTQILLEFDRCGVLPTPQRLEIADILLGKPQHLSAEHIIERLRARGSGVSKATVYNTLNLFCERGLVRECFVDPERRFYDSTSTPHHHFYVVDTGELIDIPPDGVGFSHLPQFPEDRVLESVEVMIRVRSKPPENVT